MYDPRNGYRPMEQGPSSYSKDFLAEFRAAQAARCERLDAQCIEWCEEATYYRGKLGDPARTATEKVRFARIALNRRYMLIYRTLTDPRYLDPTLDPSQRPLGSIFSYGRDPIVGNYGEGLARSMSARGWLSTWSGLRSVAALEKTLPEVRVPTQVICAMADMDIYPSECEAQYEASGADDKVNCQLEWAAHYLQPVGPQGKAMAHPQQRVAEELILPWLRERWPV